MDLKGRRPADINSGGARLRVWYEEEQSPGARPERTCYTGHVTSYIPQRGLRVWFDGFSATEQEWVDENDEWEWEEAAPLPDAAREGGITPAASFERVRIKLRQPHGKVLLASLPAADANGFVSIDNAAAVASMRSSSPRRFNKKARLLGAMSSSDGGQEASGSGAMVGAAAAAEAGGAVDEKATAGKDGSSRASKRKKRDEGHAAVSGAAAKPASGAAPSAVPTTSTHRLRITNEGIQLMLLPASGAEQAMEELSMRAPPYPSDEQAKYGICPISGLVAKYRDPLTGRRYGSLQAFQALRQQQQPHPQLVG
ncbi:hypothetical protein AB1Y20_008657 [Prymnesium parvum]|uniref:Vps72/YL1 C-terminal domain-containing protein n=1 Tax=Prymnesium parvum TaxID=97485 RepID=A0AB34ITP1_PRYPA